MSEWISVQDKAPHCTRWVLGWKWDGELGHSVIVLWSFKEGMFLAGDGNMADDPWGQITHWMPLPDPPSRDTDAVPAGE